MTNTVKITARVEAESEAGARRVGEALLSMIDAGIVSGTGPCGEDGLYRLHLAEIPASVHAYLAEQLQGDARVASWDSEVVEAVCTCDALAPKPEDVPCRRKGAVVARLGSHPLGFPMPKPSTPLPGKPKPARKNTTNTNVRLASAGRPENTQEGPS